MAPKLLLHVGLPKTGTSSIQRFLFDNRELLLDQGFYIPVFLQQNENVAGVHAWTSLLAFDEERTEPLVISFGMHDSLLRRSMRAEKWSQLNEALDKYSEHTWIVSDEILSARMLDRRDLQSLRDNFISLFAECKIVFFLRNQLDSAVGQWSTDVINGSTQKSMFLPWNLPEDPKRYLHHQNLLMLWQSCLPNSEFKVQLYDKQILTIFSEVAGFDMSQVTYIPMRENSTIPACCLQLLARYNELYPFIIDGSRPASEFRRYIPLAVQRAFSGHPVFKPDADIKKAYNEYYALSDEWVRSTYFPELTHLWNESNTFLPKPKQQLELDHDIESSILSLLDDFTQRFEMLYAASSIPRPSLRKRLMGRILRLKEKLR